MPFSKKDFLLIQDALLDGVTRTVSDAYTVKYVNPEALRRVEVSMRRHLVDAFADKLKYTSDGFDAAAFARELRNGKPISPGNTAPTSPTSMT